MHKLIWLFTLLFVTNTQAFAINVSEFAKSNVTSGYGMPSLFQLVFSLFFVIALIYTTGWIYQKLNIVNRKQISKLSKSSDSSRFTILQTMSLGQQRHIYTIEMNGKVLLVGSTPSQISLIKEFDRQESQDFVLGTSEVDAVSDSSTVSDSSKNVNIDELYKKYKS